MTAVLTTDPALATILAAARLGVELRSDGDRIGFHPRGRMTPDLADLLRDHKGAILAALSDSGDTAARIVQSVRDDGDNYLADDLRECFDERMGICTFDGGLTEANAGRVALGQLFRNMA